MTGEREKPSQFFPTSSEQSGHVVESSKKLINLMLAGLRQTRYIWKHITAKDASQWQCAWAIFGAITVH
jgi:hypothetical protein